MAAEAEVEPDEADFGFDCDLPAEAQWLHFKATVCGRGLEPKGGVATIANRHGELETWNLAVQGPSKRKKERPPPPKGIAHIERQAGYAQKGMTFNSEAHKRLDAASR